MEICPLPADYANETPTSAARTTPPPGPPRRHARRPCGGPPSATSDPPPTPHCISPFSTPPHPHPFHWSALFLGPIGPSILPLAVLLPTPAPGVAGRGSLPAASPRPHVPSVQLVLPRPAPDLSPSQPGAARSPEATLARRGRPPQPGSDRISLRWHCVKSGFGSSLAALRHARKARLVGPYGSPIM